ncbi:MAG TPA: ice-binding family protein [Solirubrobacteraceae bacterium]|nr:ice-binding family protein [Solirubrobacteraceae bacterium]
MNSGVPEKHESPPSGSLAAGRHSTSRRGRRTFRAGLIFVGALSCLLFASSALGATATVGLGTAASFSVLAGSTVTNTGPTTMFGDLGLYPGTSVTGAPRVLGQTHVDDQVAIEAKNALTTAYTNAESRPPNGSAGTQLAGQTFSPGVYNASESLLLSSGSVTLNAEGNPDAVFIFQIGSTLITGSNTTVSLVNGAQACNVFWQVGSSATLGSGTHFVGTIMASASITANTAATIHGRLLARTAAVTLEDNTITTSTCASSASGSGGGTETTTPVETEALEKATTGGGATTGAAGTTAPGTTTGAGSSPVAATTTPRLPIASKSIAKHHKHHRARRPSKPRSPARPALPHRRGSFTG